MTLKAARDGQSGAKRAGRSGAAGGALGRSSRRSPRFVEARHEARHRLLAAMWAEFYRPLIGAEAALCAYCGVPVVRRNARQGWDHVPALSVAAAGGRVDRPLWLVPCCYACNSALRAEQSECLVERARRVWRVSRGHAEREVEARLRCARVARRGASGEVRALCACPSCAGP